MITEKFLNGQRIQELWATIKTALNSKQDILTAGDGLSKEGDTLSVDTPVRSVVTQAEYDALPETQRNKGLYVIPGAGGGGSGGGSAWEAYSDEEKQIGTWFGAPLYRKSYQGQVTDGAIIATGVDKLVDITGLVYNPNITVYAYPAIAIASTSDRVQYSVSEAGILTMNPLDNWSSYAVRITVMYTKKEDAV